MKNQDTSTLGACIRMERKKAGLTQAQLGKLIGVGESRISKIEKGAPITPEVATYILGKMGSELKFRVVNTNGNAESTSFMMSVIFYFCKIKRLNLDRAYRYLKTFKGLDYLNEYMDIEKTLSYEEIASNLSVICAKNGGAL